MRGEETPTSKGWQRISRHKEATPDRVSQLASNRFPGSSSESFECPKAVSLSSIWYLWRRSSHTQRVH